MVIRRRLRRIIGSVALYLGAAGGIAYFGYHASTGDHGLEAKARYRAQVATLRSELDGVRDTRAAWERKVALLRGDAIDPDMLDERARTALNFAHPHEIVLIFRDRPAPAR